MWHVTHSNIREVRIVVEERGGIELIGALSKRELEIDRRVVEDTYF
jgi:hypothetical protein